MILNMIEKCDFEFKKKKNMIKMYGMLTLIFSFDNIKVWKLFFN